MTITHDALDLTVERSQDIRPSEMGPPHPPGHHTCDPLLVTSGGHRWRSVQTCSFEDYPHSPFLASGGRNSSGRYASYWNTFLLTLGTVQYHVVQH